MTEAEIRKVEERAEKAKEGPSLDHARLTFALIMGNYPDMGADCRFVLRLIDEAEAARKDIPKLCKEVRELQGVLKDKQEEINSLQEEAAESDWGY